MLSNWYDLVVVLAWLVSSLLGWYILSFASYRLNGGTELVWTAPLRCFVEDALCHLPGGRANRFNAIEIMMGGEEDGILVGKKYFYHYVAVRKWGLHEEVYFEVMSGHFWFWTREVVTFVIGPLVVLFVIIMLIIGACMEAGYAIRSSLTKGTTKQTAL